MPQEQKKPQPQRPLTPEELARFSDSKFTASQLQLIWKRKMPVNASLEDFEMFLYVCESKSLDPLLGEVYARLQWNRDDAEWKLIVIDGIHGMLKSADSTKEFNGIKTTFQEDADGKLISATTFVWRKGCEHPFEATAYWDEFVGTHDGKPNFFWKSKPHLMLGKCSQALALRLAFAAALAGVYVPEELDHTEIPEPESDFAVGRLAPDVSSESQTDFEVCDKGSGQNIEQAIAELVPKIVAQIESQKEPTDAPAMPLSITEVKAKNTALVQRLMGDLEVNKAIRITVLTDFYRGFLNVDQLPKEPALFTPALEALSVFADAHRDAKDQFIRGPLALGKRLREESLKHVEAKA